MGLTLPAVPNLNVNPPQIANPLDQQAKMLQLKNLMGQQQLLPLQVQEAQERVKQAGIQTSMMQLQQQSQQAMIDAVGSGFLTKYVGKDNGNGGGFDANAAFSQLVTPKDKGGFGVLPDHASAFIDSLLKRDQTMAEIAKTAGQAGEAQGSIRTKGYDALHERVADVIENPNNSATLLSDLVKNPQLFSGVPQDDLAHIYSALQAGDTKTLKAAAGALDVDKKLAEFHKAKAEETTAQQKIINPQLGMSPEQQAEGNKDVAVLKAEQPLKLEQAEAQGRAMQLIKGIEQPVYAFKPDGSKELMSATQAIQSGIKTMTPVTGKEVGDDTMLVNRLGDVRQKLARYEQAMQKDISAKDKGNMAALLDAQKLRIGAFGTEFPVARFDAAMNAENVKDLSPAARDQLVAYRNMREALVGYNRVLSGSARSGEKQFEVSEQTIPDPSTADRDMASRSFRDFRENLGVVGQGLPRIPGVKSPEEIESQVTNPATSQPKKSTSKASKYGVEIP